MNRWNIPPPLEDEINRRDDRCVYCRVAFYSPDKPGSDRTWEHIINDEEIITRENITRCCRACNSSKGTKLLADWMESSYCKQHKISRDTVADIVKLALKASPAGA
jgi:hypothetical protein